MCSESEGGGEDGGTSGEGGGGVEDDNVESGFGPSVLGCLAAGVKGSGVGNNSDLTDELVESLDSEGIGVSEESSLDTIHGGEDLLVGLSSVGVHGVLSRHPGSSLDISGTGSGGEIIVVLVTGSGDGLGESNHEGLHGEGIGLKGLSLGDGGSGGLLSADEGIEGGVNSGGGFSGSSLFSEHAGSGGGLSSGLLDRDGGEEVGVGDLNGLVGLGGGREVESVLTQQTGNSPVASGGGSLVDVVSNSGSTGRPGGLDGSFNSGGLLSGLSSDSDGENGGGGEE